ncbi:MAG: carbon-nitrogen hydrolase family protein [Thermofilaceae archaeon]
MRIGVGQTPRFDDVDKAAEWLLRRAVSVDLLVLPEYWVGAAPMDRGRFDRYVSHMARVAKEVGGLVVAGGVAVDFGGLVKSVCPVVDGGGLVGFGEKIFPSAATGERARVRPGSRLAAFRAGGWTAGCLICVDLLYPELARRLTLAGAEVLVNPASISADRRGLWRAVGVVRAFENSVYVAAALGTGYSYPDGRPVAGGSFVASPNGAVAEFGEEPGVYVFDLEKSELEYARARRKYLDDAASLQSIYIDFLN